MKHTVSTLARVLLVALLALSLAVQATGVSAAEEEKCKNPLIDNCRGNNDIRLMQPLDDETESLEVSSTPLEVFFEYFNMSWPWLLGVASGIAVLQAVWGGILIMTSWDQDGGKEKIQWALGGMVMIALAGFILRFLNPIFFR